MRNTILIAMLFALAGSVTSTRAQDADKEKTPDVEVPGKQFDVTDHEKIKAEEGQTVSVKGTVKEVFTPRSGARKLVNYEGIARGDFNVMIPKEAFDALNAAFNGDFDAAVKGKTITVTGRVSLYRENPQIEVTTPEQIKIEGEEAKKDEPAKEDEKKPEEKPKE